MSFLISTFWATAAAGTRFYTILSTGDASADLSFLFARIPSDFFWELHTVFWFLITAFDLALGGRAAL